MKIKRFIWPITIVILVILAYVLYDKANQIHQSQALRPQVYIIYLVRMIWVEIF